MTVPSTARRAGPFLGNGVTTTFSFSFKTFAAADLLVTKMDALGLETTLVLNSDYSVTLNPDQDASPGGTITYPLSGSALPAGQKLTVVGDLDYEQTTDLLGGGAFNARVIEDTFDRIVIQIQQLEERLDRAVSVPVSSTASAELPAPEGSALLGWNGGGTALENVPLSSLATAVAYGTMRWQTFVGNGTTTAFALPHDPATVANLDVSIAGVVQVPGTDYTLVGQNVVFTSAPPNGATILVRYGQALGSVPSDSNDISFLQAGTGAVTRTAQAKMREFVSPEDFGAIGNNAADDTGAMTAALNAAVALGLRLRLKDGASYFLATWSTYTGAGVLRVECVSATGGAGNATLRGPASAVTFLSPVANFDVQGVRFSAWASVVSRTAAQLGSFTHVVFSNNRCENCTGVVINIERPIDQFRIEGNSIENCTGGYAIRIGENTYANQDTWQKGWIRGNYVKSLSATGSVSAVAILVYGREITIADNKIDGVTQSGTGECWGIYTKARYSQVYGNYVNNVVASGNSDNVGVNIKGTTRAVTSSPQGFASMVWGNHVRNIGSVGVRGAGIRVQTDDVLVFGNECENTGASGLVSDESSTYSNAQFQNNFVRWVSLTAGTTGIGLEGSGTGVVADNNTVRNATTGIVLRTGPASSTMRDAQVTRNKLFGCTNNVVFDAFSGCTLDRAVIDANVVDGGTFGLLHNGSSGTISNMRVRFNDLSRASTPASGAILSTAATAHGNIGWLSASTTWDPASIPNGSSAATTLTVANAALGDAVVASFSNALNGLVLAAQVSAANTVEVRLLNSSGGAVDLGSGTVKVQVIKGVA